MTDSRGPSRPIHKIVAAASLLLPGAIVVLTWSSYGPLILAVAAVATLLYVVAKYDNHTGSCLTVTILALIVVAVVVALMILMAVLGVSHG